MTVPETQGGLLSFEDLRRLAAAYLPDADLDLLDKAFRFSRLAHEGQRRRSGEEYIQHPLAVACILAELELDRETLVAALLHDVAEDTQVTLEQIESRLPVGTPVVRVMPNLPCTVGEGMSVYCLGRRARRADARTAVRLLTCFGRVREVPERLFDAVTALSGSGPAFFAYVLDALARGAQKEGLTRSDALLLAEQTMLGTARLLLDTGQEPEALIQAVASPKGTTVAGLTVLTASPVSTILARAIRAAARRSRELSRPTRGEKSVSTAVGTAGSGRRLLAAPRRV